MSSLEEDINFRIPSFLEVNSQTPIKNDQSFILAPPFLSAIH